MKSEEIQKLINRLKIEGVTSETIPMIETFGVQHKHRSTYCILSDLSDKFREVEKEEQKETL